ncbi:MAG: hypothetical protein IJO77_03345, partial [Oscillospiraceae bacterium]|nr:hypothetical protein [Oscillospiraceae bacterium]
MKKFLIVDGNSILNRAYYGVRILTNKDGLPTNAIFGMVNILSKQIEAVKPDYMAVAFDLKAPTFRHKMYADYKAGMLNAYFCTETNCSVEPCIEEALNKGEDMLMLYKNKQTS